MLDINLILTNPLIPTTINIILILIGAYIVSKIIEKIVKHFWSKYNLDFAGYYLVNDIFKYIIGIVALAWILNEIGIDLRGIFISVGVIGIIVGFAAKDIFSNFMSGILLLSEKTIKTGEVIEIQNNKGRITKVNLRTTTLKTIDNYTITIPNNTLSNNPYTIYNKLELNKIKLKILIPYYISIKEFEEKLNTKVKETPRTLKEKPPYINDIKLTEFGNEIEYLFWIEDYNKLSEYKVKIIEEAEKLINEF